MAESYVPVIETFILMPPSPNHDLQKEFDVGLYRKTENSAPCNCGGR